MSLTTAAALRNVRDTVSIVMEHTDEQAAVIVADEGSQLARLLVSSYRQCLPAATIVLFDDTRLDAMKEAFVPLRENDLVVLIQSSVFRIPDYRIRVELFRRNIKVIEHSNLNRMEGAEIEHYVDALAYDPAYYRTMGHALKSRMDAAQSVRVESGGEVLHFSSPLEPAKINIGHFAGMKNVGSLFPIGEVFTEARDLEKVSGRVTIYGFADMSHRLNVPEAPITLVIERGRVVSAVNSTPDFDLVLSSIQAAEGEVWIRELGFGMNRAFSKERRASDVGAFERVCGVHLSLGASHGVYKKQHLERRASRYHVDTFVQTDRVLLDDKIAYAAGAWLA